MKNTSSSWAITIHDLHKSYGTKKVLEGIQLKVREGTVFSLLGPNGAGKTTLVQILSTYIRADAGEVQVMGHNLKRESERVRRSIGVTGQFSAVDNLLTGEENLRLMADLHHLSSQSGQRRTFKLLEQFELLEAAKQLPSTYSGGMRRRLDLAMTLVGSPRIIFLDEPTTGLDPRSRQTLWQNVRDLVASGITIFLTTQYLEEADQLADHIAVLNEGKLVAEGSPAELKRLVPGGHIRLQFAEVSDFEAASSCLPNGVGDNAALTLQVPSDGSVKSLREVLELLERASIEVESLSVHTPNLDDVFFALTGKSHPQEVPA